MTTPLDPITITVLGIIVALFFPLVSLLFALIAFSQGNMIAGLVFLVIFLLAGGSE